MARVQTTHSVDEPSRRHFLGLAFLLLVIVPFVPVIVILSTVGLAWMMGCQLVQAHACVIPAGDVIGFVLKVTAGFIVAYTSNSNLIGGFITAGLFLVIVGWQTACYVVLSKRWTSVRSRLLAGFAVALLFAILPYFGLLMATAPLKNNISCRLPDSKGSYACHAFGSYVGSADYNPMVNAGQLGWLFLIGAPLALGMFALYAVFVVVEGRSANRTANSA